VHGRALAAEALRVDLTAEAAALRATELWRSRGHVAKTLIKYADLRVVLMVFRAGARLHEHVAEERIALQTVSGHVRLTSPAGTFDLPSGHLLTLDHAVPHDVEAIDESTLLLFLSAPED